MKHSQRGYSLVELSIVLAIIAVVIAGAVTGVQSILRTNNTNKTVLQTSSAIGKITAKLMRDPDYGNATLAYLTTAGFEIWPDSLISKGGTTDASVVNPFGGRVYVAALTAGAGGASTNQGAVYALAGIPTASCADVAAGLEGMASMIVISNEAMPTSAPTTMTGTSTVKDSSAGTRFSSSTVATACNPSTNPTATTTIKLLITR